MKLLLFIFCTFISIQTFAQGTMSTDDTQASEAAASMSGTTDQEIDLREEEVQLDEEMGEREMQEEKYDPTIDDEPIIIQPGDGQ